MAQGLVLRVVAVSGVWFPCCSPAVPLLCGDKAGTSAALERNRKWGQRQTPPYSDPNFRSEAQVQAFETKPAPG